MREEGERRIERGRRGGRRIERGRGEGRRGGMKERDRERGKDVLFKD